MLCGVRVQPLRERASVHHVDPAAKSFEVNPSTGKALARYLEEAKKCVLVCANCHAEIEAGVTPCPPLSACWPPSAGSGGAS